MRSPLFLLTFVVVICIQLLTRNRSDKLIDFSRFPAPLLHREHVHCWFVHCWLLLISLHSVTKTLRT